MRYRYSAEKLERIVHEDQGRRVSWLAEQTGIGRVMLYHLLAGRRPISDDHAERLAEALDVPLTELIEDEELISR